MEIENDSLSSLKYYRKSFSSLSNKILPTQIFPLQNYLKINESFHQACTTKQNQINLFFGIPGNGRKTAIYNSLNSLTANGYNIKLLTVDARIHNTEKALIERLFSLFLTNDIINQTDKVSKRPKSFLFAEVNEILKVMKFLGE